jgi:hypothetical protein
VIVFVARLEGCTGLGTGGSAMAGTGAVTGVAATFAPLLPTRLRGRRLESALNVFPVWELHSLAKVGRFLMREIERWPEPDHRFGRWLIVIALAPAAS